MARFDRSRISNVPWTMSGHGAMNLFHNQSFIWGHILLINHFLWGQDKEPQTRRSNSARQSQAMPAKDSGRVPPPVGSRSRAETTAAKGDFANIHRATLAVAHIVKSDVVDNRCLFCGIEGGEHLSEEDAIPRWLLHHLGTPSHDKRVHAVVSAQTGDVLRKEITSSFRFVEPRICERNCNNGWMSRLESAARDFLVPLIDGSKALGDVRWSEAAVVAKWAVKTAYVHSWAIPLELPVPLEQMSAICGDQAPIPTGVGVFGMQAPFVKPTAYSAARLLAPHRIRRASYGPTAKGLVQDWSSVWSPKSGRGVLACSKSAVHFDQAACPPLATDERVVEPLAWIRASTREPPARSTCQRPCSVPPGLATRLC